MMNTPTPTPITDKAKIAFTSLFVNDDGYCIPYVVGVKLERELTAAREELAKWSILKGWGGTPEIINDFIKGQQTRIYYERNLEEDLTLAQEEITLLKNAIANNNDAARAEYIELKEQRDTMADLVKQFIYILDIREESDGGRLFHPTNITSCRAGDLQKIGELVEALRRASRDQPTEP